MSDWNAELYLRFEKQRTQPSRDLAARVRQLRPARVIDIGCGPGNSTAVLRETFPDADLLGIDRSEAMLRRARATHPDLAFSLCDVWDTPAGADLLFSNACLQWVPDHPRLLPRLMDALAPGGTLAVQMPRNAEEPLFGLIRAVAAESRWGLSATNFEDHDVLDPQEYHRILSGCTAHYELWETVYHHILPDHEAMLDWVRSARLRPYLDQLAEPVSSRFVAEILSRAREVYPTDRDGNVLLRYRRLFFTAQK